MKGPLLVIVGPTAVGKTAISVAVARRIGGEIISGDSMQVYRKMDIGTAKVRPDEMLGVPHHLIDIKEPSDPFSVAEFQRQVDDLITLITARGRLPILVGGTGLYVRSITQDYSFTEAAGDADLREFLRAAELHHGPGHLHRQLQGIDPAAAAKLHPNDLRRLIRALEVYETTGSPISETQHAQGNRRYDDLFVVLNLERDALYRRIDTRVDAMMALGLASEVKSLLQFYPHDTHSLQAIGYREMVWYLRGLSTYQAAIELIKRNTRRFAKRQLTWFRREDHATWIDVTNQQIEKSVEEIVSLVEGKWPRNVEAHG